jgi:hypothetical protein
MKKASNQNSRPVSAFNQQGSFRLDVSLLWASVSSSTTKMTMKWRKEEGF